MPGSCLLTSHLPVGGGEGGGAQGSSTERHNVVNYGDSQVQEDLWKEFISLSVIAI